MEVYTGGQGVLNWEGEVCHLSIMDRGQAESIKMVFHTLVKIKDAGDCR